MQTGHSIIYGIIQGLTEFLPVSSSAHLALLPKFLEISDPGVFFDLSMHLGTAFAVVIYYFKDLKSILGNLWHKPGPLHKRSPIIVNLVLSSTATFVLALAIKGPAKTLGRTPGSIAAMLIGFSILMVIAHFLGKKEEPADSRQGSGILEREIHPWRALLLGICQSFAIFPGGSRSGITISVARLLGMGRTEAGRYSFLMALPVILGGIVFLFLEEKNSFEWTELLLGLGVSFLAGWFAIYLFMGTLKRLGLMPFVFYRLALAIYLLTIVF
jgi:undecaprenyl-diphosphatase